MEEQFEQVAPEIREKFLLQVEDDYTASLKMMHPKHEQWLEYLSMYHGEKPADRPKGMANLPVSLVQEGVDSFIADALDKIFGSELSIDTKGRERYDEQYAAAIGNMIKYQAYFDKWKAKLRELLFSFTVFGSAPAKVVYREQYGKIIRNQPLFYPNAGTSSMPAYEGQQPIDSVQRFVEEMIYAGPTLIPIDIFSFFPNIDMINITDYLSVVHRFKLSPATLLERARQGTYFNVKTVLRAIEEGAVSESTEAEEIKERRRQMSGMAYNPSDVKYPECLEWQGPFDINDDGIDEDCIGVVCNVAGEEEKNVLLRLEELPYATGEKTYIMGKAFRVPGEFWGIGIVEKIANDQKAATALRNAMLDGYYKQSSPRTYIEDDAIPNEAELDIPRGIVHVTADEKPINGKFSVEPVYPIGSDGYQLYQNIINEAAGKSGVSESKAGRIPGQKTTATVGSQAFAQASIRFKDMLWMYEDSVIIPLCAKSHEINQQFIDKPYAISIIGKDGVYWQKVDPTQIAARVNFIPLASSKNADKQVNIEQIMRNLQITSSNQMLMGAAPIIYIQLMEEWGVRNLDEIKVAIGYQAMMAQLHQAAQQQITPWQMMMMQGAQYGQPLPISGAQGNNIPYGGEQEQTPTNTEELIAKVHQPMTSNFPVAR